jgi:hypothetical protein
MRLGIGELAAFLVSYIIHCPQPGVAFSFRRHDMLQRQLYCSRRKCMLLYPTPSGPREAGAALRWWWNPFRVPDGKPQLKQASQRESRAEASHQHHRQHQQQQFICYYISMIMLAQPLPLRKNIRSSSKSALRLYQFSSETYVPLFFTTAQKSTTIVIPWIVCTPC